MWSENAPFLAGAGGTENHTLERSRRLRARGVDAEIVIITRSPYDPGFTDVPVSFVADVRELCSVDDTIVYIARGHDIPTRRPSFLFLHFPIDHADSRSAATFRAAAGRSRLITNSLFSRQRWAGEFGMRPEDIAVVHPFAHPAFAQVTRASNDDRHTVLYPNRITPEKGLFVFLEAVALLGNDPAFEFVVTGAGHRTPVGERTAGWLRRIPGITYTEPLVDRRAMAELYARADVVVVPSRDDYWQEPFGMTSVEGQHAGCRVIASDSGGLRETDCGLLDLVPAGDAWKLARRIVKVVSHPAVTDAERARASERLTLDQNVDTFLAIVEPG